MKYIFYLWVYITIELVISLMLRIQVFWFGKTFITRAFKHNYHRAWHSSTFGAELKNERERILALMEENDSKLQKKREEVEHKKKMLAYV